MNAAGLNPGDVFLEVSREDWDRLSRRDRRKLKPVTMRRALGVCSAPAQIHMETSAGTWCIHDGAPVMLLESRDKERPERSEKVPPNTVKAVA